MNFSAPSSQLPELDLDFGKLSCHIGPGELNLGASESEQSVIESFVPNNGMKSVEQTSKEMEAIQLIIDDTIMHSDLSCYSPKKM